MVGGWACALSTLQAQVGSSVWVRVRNNIKPGRIGYLTQFKPWHEGYVMVVYCILIKEMANKVHIKRRETLTPKLVFG